jgi:Tfp pilus assembly PilM family ATPase
VIAGRRLLFDQAVDFGEQALLHKLADNLDLSVEAVQHLIETHGLPRDAQVAGSVGMGSEVDVPATLLDVLKPSFLQLVEEINRVLVFTASETRGRPMGRIVVLGGLARWAGFPQVLCSLVGIQGHSGYSELEACFDDQSRQQDAMFPEMAVAVGLALRGLVEDV